MLESEDGLRKNEVGGVYRLVVPREWYEAIRKHSTNWRVPMLYTSFALIEKGLNGLARMTDEEMKEFVHVDAPIAKLYMRIPTHLYEVLRMYADNRDIGLATVMRAAMYLGGRTIYPSVFTMNRKTIPMWNEEK